MVGPVTLQLDKSFITSVFKINKLSGKHKIYVSVKNGKIYGGVDTWRITRILWALLGYNYKNVSIEIGRHENITKTNNELFRKIFGNIIENKIRGEKTQIILAIIRNLLEKNSVVVDVNDSRNREKTVEQNLSAITEQNAVLAEIQKICGTTTGSIEVNSDFESSKKITSLRFIAYRKPLSTPELFNVTGSLIASLKKLPSLKELTFKNCYLTQDVIAPLSTLTTLTALDFSKSYPLSDHVIDVLRHCIWLTWLNLTCGYEITDQGIALLKSLRLLKSLNLSYCFKITDKAMESLSRITSLISLNLTRCDTLTDKGIAQLKTLPLLKTLDLSECYNLTDATLKSLESFPALRIVYLKMNWKFSVQAIKSLHDHGITTSYSPATETTES